jgi:hypothetical protein
MSPFEGSMGRKRKTPRSLDITERRETGVRARRGAGAGVRFSLCTPELDEELGTSSLREFNQNKRAMITARTPSKTFGSIGIRTPNSLV